MKEKSQIEKKAEEKQITLLSTALSEASNAGGHWLNASGKGYPRLYPTVSYTHLDVYKRQPVEKRLDLLNGIIGADFADKVTMEQLNSEQRISIGLHPEVQHEDVYKRQDIARAGKATKDMVDYIREKQIVKNALS